MTLHPLPAQQAELRLALIFRMEHRFHRNESDSRKGAGRLDEIPFGIGAKFLQSDNGLRRAIQGQIAKLLAVPRLEHAAVELILFVDFFIASGIREIVEKGVN